MSDIALTSPPTQIGLFDRALRRVATLWRDMASAVSGNGEESVEEQMRACLAGRGGEVSARNRAARLAQEYLAADDAGRLGFLRALAGFDSDAEAVTEAMARVGAAQDAAERASAKARLRRVLDPPRLRLLTQFTAIPDGMKFLVDLRADLLRVARGDAMLGALEADLKSLLANYFDVGFLDLRRIDWSSPASLLERLVGYEAVHRIRTWRDLKNRLDSDRRCYAFFHPRMPEEPLIFVEVALVKGMSGNVQCLLDEKAPLLDPKEADTAVFYSINNCQRGLDGISFGNFLIKRVVALLGAEFRNLKAFATLSPVPGFCRWLERALAEDPKLLSEAEAAALLEAAPPLRALPAPAASEAASAPAGAASAATISARPGSGVVASSLPVPDAEQRPPPEGAQALRRLLARRGWTRDEAVAKVLEPVLTRLCARYLLTEGHPRNPKRALDPVAHFHLSNGARVERLNWRGDISEKGLRESAGLMVNYLYDPAKIEDNHEGYAGEGRRAAATTLRRLARGWS